MRHYLTHTLVVTRIPCTIFLVVDDDFASCVPVIDDDIESFCCVLVIPTFFDDNIVVITGFSH